MELHSKVSTIDTEAITGVYTNTIMRDYQSGYTVFSINTSSEIITCVGNIIVPSTRMKVEVTGIWQNTKYGKQLSDCTINEVFTDKDAMLEYLCEIPNVGLKTAQDLIEAFEERVYEIATGPDAIRKLKTIPSVSERRAESVVRYIKKTQEWRKFFELITKHGGSYNSAYKIYKEYGADVVGKFLENPYAIGAKAGLSFAVCDSIAKEYSPNPYSKMRISAAITQILKKEANAGHTYLLYLELMKQTRKMLGVTEYDEAVATACINATLVTHREGIHQEDDAVYLSHLYYKELRTAFAVRRLVAGAKKIECDVEELVAYAEKICGVQYADKQREAFNLVANGGLGILTGGPGTGKTTVVRGFIEAYKKLFPDNLIQLCAPTGRASQRMKEATGREATTIHRLLEYRPFDDIITYKNEADPIGADCLLVDESSMISIEMADVLLSAVKTGTTVILVGDIDQLPAVGAGNVLHDLIESRIVPTVALTKTYRQAGDSLIIENAKRIRDGITKLKQGDDFIIIEADDTDIPELTKAEFVKHNKEGDVFAAQILSPARRKKTTGSNALNQTVQGAVNNNAQSLKYGDTTFRVGDKVMFMRNNYTDGYFNGDVGIIENISYSKIYVSVDGNVLELDEELIDDLSLAYVCTIHKSQGSEYQTAVVVLPSEPDSMLQRNLLYTAITRAKKKVVLIAAENAIRKSIITKNALKRKSKLVQRLREA